MYLFFFKKCEVIVNKQLNNFTKLQKNHTNMGLKRFSNGNRGYCASDTITDCASATLQKPIVQTLMDKLGARMRALPSPFWK